MLKTFHHSSKLYRSKVSSDISNKLSYKSSNSVISTYIQVSYSLIDLSLVTVRCSGGGGCRQYSERDLPSMPVTPVDFVLLHIDIHSINAHILITSKCLLICRVGIEWIEASDLIIISNVQHLIIPCEQQRNKHIPAVNQDSTS